MKAEFTAFVLGLADFCPAAAAFGRGEVWWTAFGMTGARAASLTKAPSI